MFAVLKTGGKQYKVQSGDLLRVEKLAADAGETVQFNEVLMLGGDSPGRWARRSSTGAAVQAEVIDQVKGDKVISFVKRRRKHGSQRTRGHRQKLTLLRVTDILAQGGDATGVKAAIGAGSVAGGGKAPPRPRRLRRRPPRRRPRRLPGPTTSSAVGCRPGAREEAARGRRDQFRADRRLDRGGCRRDG